ncbi:AI-2E family transporter [Brachybacterium sp. MASK1Z-5]|uniref:AI-2E family transporter n=1 Tax=Brachybacterium halotolerans TaxID=2795215 RepID=A0ABS1B978_9MICO|nr:AI-2E family transporter [Brachybacterium halotolerans]MBK0331169.1 AI-2E family transporter [Brachybacterium halotolerans]
MTTPRRRFADAESADESPSTPREVAEIPIGIRRLGAWSWRLIVITAAAALIIWGILKITAIVIPVLIAILVASLLSPLVGLLTRHTFLGRAAASGVALVALIIVVIGMFTLASRQLFAQAGDIYAKALTGVQTLIDWANTTFNLDDSMINKATDEILAKLQENTDSLISGAFSTVSTVGNVVTGIVIALFTLFFLLSGGSTIWRWVVGLLPPAARVPTHEAFRRGWKALSAYMRTQIMVAAVDATGISIGMIALGVGSYAVPIWLLVFLFSFVPLVGAILSGAIAILIVLVLKGWVFAIIMLAVVIAVQQIEGNVLQPFLMGKAVELHPLAVFLGVASGAMIAGIAGALFAIPVIAFVNATLLYMTGRDPSPDLGLDETVDAQLTAPPKPKKHEESPREAKRRAKAESSKAQAAALREESAEEVASSAAPKHGEEPRAGE